jgi:hypothetical protein
MPDKEDKKNFKDRMNDIQETAKEQDLGDNPKGMLVTATDFPDLNNLDTPEISKYKDELAICLVNSKEIIDNLASLWLDGDENVLQQSYIKSRIERDAKNQGSLDFLSSVAQQVLLKQLNLMEQGDQSPRHFEIIYKGMGELEKINKSASNSLSLMESFYRKLRFDLGFEDMPKFGRENKKLDKDGSKTGGFSGSMKDLNKFLEEKAKSIADEKEAKKSGKNKPDENTESK